ncbi:hypothetical protein ACU5DF_10950 [Aliivibrio wodanis]|uniref:hypothetical protein n=1 Tax=Aliivibrio wodanis TaxID=80852 RepID=UPI00406D28FD
MKVSINQIKSSYPPSLENSFFEAEDAPHHQDNHYTCCECFAAWYGSARCISCKKQKFVVTTSFYSKCSLFDIC